ncbi:hypothetical protein QBC43DRAFT_184804, partial [Cladorrhinum sp. PSN259]
MRGGLQLGSMHKYLAVHCPEQIEHYLRHIYNIWTAIIGNNLCLTTLVDDKVIRMLHLKVPSNREDRQWINIIFDTNKILPTNSNASLRDEIKANVLALDAIIPSIWTFHEDMRYFAIGIRIIQQYIAHNTAHESLIASLSRMWKYTPVVEVSECEFDIIGSTNVELAFQQLLLFTLRHFPLLSNEKPLQNTPGEYLQPGISLIYIDKLYYLAYQLGFHTPKV